jgi:hypothetical protein
MKIFSGAYNFQIIQQAIYFQNDEVEPKRNTKEAHCVAAQLVLEFTSTKWAICLFAKEYEEFLHNFILQGIFTHTKFLEDFVNISSVSSHKTIKL